MIEFITIQEISSKFPNVYIFLKGMGYNTHKNIFFKSFDGHINGAVTEPKILMLRQDGMMFTVDCVSGIYQIVSEFNTNLTLSAIEIARRAVNLKHHYLRETLVCIEKSLNMRPSNALF